MLCLLFVCILMDLAMHRLDLYRLILTSVSVTNWNLGIFLC